MNGSSIEEAGSGLWGARFGPEDVRLRFELGGEFLDNTFQQVPRFLHAHRRASPVADALFHQACVGVAWNGRMRCLVGLGDEIEDGFVALQSTGFCAPLVSEWQATLFPDSDDNAYVWDMRSYDLGHNNIARDTLLWHAVASEMPIYPSAPVRGFLLDPRTSVMLHVYDDRGMDVIADDPTKLHGLFRFLKLAPRLRSRSHGKAVLNTSARGAPRLRADNLVKAFPVSSHRALA